MSKLLLEYGTKPNEVSRGIGKPDSSIADFPLMVASRSGNLEIVKFLVHEGAKVNKSNDSKDNALTEAFIQDKLDVALYLLESGAKYEISLFDRSKFTENGSKMYLSNF